MPQPLDANSTLDGFRLQDALVSIYCTFASVLRGRGTTDAPSLYLNDIPRIVFDVAVGAGWIPLAEKDFDPAVGTSKGDVVWQADWQVTDKMELPQWVLDNMELAKKKKDYQPPTRTQFTENQRHRLVQFGDWIVDRRHLDSFYGLLNDTISFHLAEGTAHDEHVKLLPKTTSEAERKVLLQQYIDGKKANGEDVDLKQLAERADIDYSVLMKWRKGPKDPNEKGVRIADTSEPGQRILLLLIFDERSKARHYRRAHTS